MCRPAEILWENSWNDIKRHMDDLFNGDLDISVNTIMGMYSKVYNTSIGYYNNETNERIRFSDNLYKEMIKYHEDLVDRLIEDHNEHFDKHGLDVKHKDFVLWTHYQYIIRWNTKIFLWLDEFYTKRSNLPSIPNTLQQCWISKGLSPYTKDIEEEYMNKWKALLRAKQKLQLAKLSYFPDDLYDIINTKLSSNPVTNECAFKTLHIHLEYNTSRSLIRNFGLMD